MLEVHNCALNKMDDVDLYIAINTTVGVEPSHGVNSGETLSLRDSGQYGTCWTDTFFSTVPAVDHAINLINLQMHYRRIT
jgi:hypothetical protein